MKKNKQQKLQSLYQDGKILLPYGSYTRIAKELSLSRQFVTMVLSTDPDDTEWNEKVYKAALNIMKQAAKVEKELSQQAAAAIKQWGADFEAAANIMKEVNNG